MLVPLVDLASNLQPIQIGYTHIQYDDIRMEHFDLPHYLNTSAGFTNDGEIWFSFQQETQSLPQYGMIISQQYRNGHFHSLSGQQPMATPQLGKFPVPAQFRFPTPHRTV
jgi:hypothetical protein